MFKVTGPVVQHLGFQGDHYHLKVVFPVDRIEDTDPNYHDVEQAKTPVGMRAIILKFRAEDLPMHTVHGEILHCDIGDYLRQTYGSGES